MVQCIRVGREASVWYTRTSSGTTNSHLNRADAVQTALLWAQLYQPATVVLIENGCEEVIASFPSLASGRK